MAGVSSTVTLHKGSAGRAYSGVASGLGDGSGLGELRAVAGAPSPVTVHRGGACRRYSGVASGLGDGSGLGDLRALAGSSPAAPSAAAGPATPQEIGNRPRSPLCG